MAGFNKMFVMLPIMLAARKLDGEDPVVIYWLRVAYFSVQAIAILVVMYTYFKATEAAKGDDRVVYVPPPPQPFADPTAKKKYTQVTYGAHVASTARSLLGSTLFGIVLTTGLHMWRGMVMGLAIQAVMAPLNLFENALIKSLILGKGIRKEDKIFDEKTADELTADDVVVDEAGNVIVVRTGSKIKVNGERSFEELLLDTWDAGSAADIGPLMAAISKKNCNYKTQESKWTPLMILGGLGAKGTGSAIRQVIEVGGNPALVDGEGWNALHWAAFHNSIDGCKALRDSGTLYAATDKEGKTPLDHARAEGNDEVAKLLEEKEKESSTDQTSKSDEGIRKRK